MKDVLLVLTGAAASIVGGVVATWYRARIAGRVRFQETIAERKVPAYGKGLELISQLQPVLLQCGKKDALAFLYDNGSWFADNLILLPHTFVENWRSIRCNLKKAIMYEDALEKEKGDDKRKKMADQVRELWELCDSLAKEAESSIRKELGLPECVIKHPPDARADAQAI